jgi:glycerol-3-phosphate acyltransferase PlsY
MAALEAPSLVNLSLASLVAYLLGALPFAYGVSKTRGVNIFAVGSGQAGSTNVYRHVGPRYAAIVFFGDVAKGALSILFGGWLGISGAWLLVPALAATMGHWNSVFTGFKGGDGVATGLGIALVLAPFAVAIPMIVAAFVLWRWHWTSHPTLWGGLAGFAAFLAVSRSSWGYVEPGVVLGITVICAAILVHSIVYHRRRAARLYARARPGEDANARTVDGEENDRGLVEERQR